MKAKPISSQVDLTCRRCKGPFSIRLEVPPGARWFPAKVPKYCPACHPAWIEAVQSAHQRELLRALKAGERTAERRGRPLSVSEVETLAVNCGEDLPTHLAEAEVALKPLDWFHDHSKVVIEQLSQQRWWWRPVADDSIVLQVLPDGELTRWIGSYEDLPPAAAQYAPNWRHSLAWDTGK